MINIWITLLILFWHWLMDFIFQTDYMAVNKSKSNKALLFHTYVYSIGWVAPMIMLLGQKAGIFLLITFVAHTITDYFTSRLNSKLWAEKKTHWFFVSIGFDQWLHFTQLLLTYYYCCK